MEGFSRAGRALAVFLFVVCYGTASTFAATEYLPKDYFLLPADVDGDFRMDAVAQPLEPGREAVILLGIGVDDPKVVFQRLADIDPDLAWDKRNATILIGDFSGDGRDDLFLQGNYINSIQATLIAGEDGRFTQAIQKFSGDHMGFEWSAEQRSAITGDFDGNGQAEMLMQGRQADDVHLVVRPNADGILNTSGPSWVDGYLGLRWNARNIELYAGDFNGDGRSDLLWRRNAASKPRNDEPAVALLLSDGNGEFSEVAQSWDEDFLGAEWDPATHDIRIADINGDGIDDIVLTARNAGGTHYLVPGRMDGKFQEVALAWQGDETAEQAWAARPGGAADITVNAQQDVSERNRETTAVSAKGGPVQAQSTDNRSGRPVGTLPGEFSVDPTGAANYRIPIEVPPGVGGMQPDLAFLYSSRAGNGLLGQGWSLSGLSAITRCPQSIAQSGDTFRPVTFENTDSFCLDGQLLKKNGGTASYGGNGAIYGTELSSFQRVESRGGNNGSTDAYTGPDHFIVKDKAGLIREYGRTAASRQRLGDTNIAKQWSLSKILDRYGNYIRFDYEKDVEDGMQAYRPSQISWHNNNDVLIGKVTLEYGERPDVTKGSEPFIKDANRYGNSLFKRLKQLKVYARGSLVRSYNIHYKSLRPSGISAIDSIEMCSASGACLPPTSFEWSESVEGFDHSYRIEGENNAPLNLDHLKFGDMNGDGRTDGIYFAGDDLYWIDLVTKEVTDTEVTVGSFEKEAAVVMDFDGDGLSDLLIASEDDEFSAPSTWHVISLNEGGDYEMKPAGAYARGWNSHPVPIDVNNDGYPELVFLDDDNVKFYRNLAGEQFDANEVVLMSYRVSGSQRIVPGEFNGDGRPDFLLTSKSGDSNGHLYFSDGTTFRRQSFVRDGSTTFYSTEAAVAADINGDGLTDLLAKKGLIGDTAGSADWYTYINIGGHFKRTAQRPDETDNRHLASRIVDANRDGVADVLLPRESGWSVTRYNPIPEAWASASLPRPPSVDDTTPFYFLDVDGDSVTDILYKEGNYWRVRLGTGGSPGLLRRATNGLGDMQEARYWPVNKVDDSNSIYLGHDPREKFDHYADFYTEDSLAVASGSYNHYRLPPLMVVSEIETGTGTLDTEGDERRIRTSYRYGGAMVNTRGRGFLGFRMLASSNQNTGMETVNIHRQAFPYTGMVETAIQKVPDATITTVTPDPYYESCFQTRTEPDPRCGFSRSTTSTTTPGSLISRTDNEFSSSSETADGGEFPYVELTTETSYRFPHEHDGDPPVERITTTLYEYDGTVGGKVTGDPTRIIVNTSTDGGTDDLHTVETTNQYADNRIDAHWCLGRLTNSTVRHEAPIKLNANPSDGVQIRKATFGYEKDVRSGSEMSCRLQTETSDADQPHAVTTSHTFDNFGNKDSTSISTVNDGSRTTRREYDYYGLFPRSRENALGHRESYVWDHRFGKKLATTGPNGLTTRRQYDGFGRLLAEFTPRDTVSTTHQLAWCGTGPKPNCIARNAVYYSYSNNSTGADAYEVTEYDSLSREVGSRAPDSLSTTVVKTEVLYDSLGRPYLQSLPFTNEADRCWKHTLYNALGRPVKVSTPPDENYCADSEVPDEAESVALYPGNVTSYVYDGLASSGTLTRVNTTAGHEKRIWKNVMDRVVRVSEYDGSKWIDTRYDYDPLGNTTVVEPPGGQSVVIDYDAAGRKTGMSDPDMGDWSYDYNGFGELLHQVDAEGNEVEMSYDPLGRMVTRIDTPSEGAPTTTTWHYDDGYGASKGKLVHVSKSDGYTETYAYNEYGQRTDTVRVIDGEVFWTTQTYDSFGRPDIIVYPDVATFDLDETPLDAFSVTVSARSDGQPTIHWDAASDLARYSLYRNDTNDYESAVQIYTGPLTSHPDQVDEDGTWYYWVTAHHGDASRLAGPASIAVQLPPTAPEWLVVEDFDDNFDRTIDVSWEPSQDAASYRILRASAFDGAYSVVKTVNAPATAIEISDLAEGEHYFQVQACKQVGTELACSDPTNGLNPAFVMLPPPVAGKPLLDESDGNNNGIMTVEHEVTVSWPVSADPDVNGYELDIYTVSGSNPPVFQQTLRGAGGSQVIGGFAAGDYQFKVRLCKSNNLGQVCGEQDSPFSERLKVGIVPEPIEGFEGPASGYTNSRAFNLTFERPSRVRRDQLYVDEASNGNFDPVLRSLSFELESCGVDSEGEPIPLTKCPPPEELPVTNATSGEKWYRIKACNGFGCSPWTETPGPTDVRVAPEDTPELRVPSRSNDGSYTVSWDPSPTDVDVRYELYESTDPSNFDGNPYELNGLEFQVDNKGDGEKYHYQLRACYKTECSDGVISGQVLVRFPPLPPPTFNVSPDDFDGSYVLTWTHTESDFFERYELHESTSDFQKFEDHQIVIRSIPVQTACVRWDPGDGGCLMEGPVGNSAEVNGRSDGTYYYRVRACNSVDCGDWKHGSNGIVVRTYPSKPSSISSPLSAGGPYTVTWGAASGPVTKYQLYESRNGGSYSLLYSGSGRSKSVANGNGKYSYRVRACNGSKCSGYRSGASTTVYIRDDGGGGGGCDPRRGCYEPKSSPDEPLLEGLEDAPETDSAPETSGEETDGSEPANQDGLSVGAVENVSRVTGTELGTVASRSARNTDGVVKVSARRSGQDTFRAMPPQRPGDFYRELRRGRAHAASPSQRTAAQPDARRAAPVAGSRRATGHPVEARPVKLVTSARPAARTFDGSPSKVEESQPDRLRRSGSTSVDIQKIGNEPAGTYAHAIKHEYDPNTGVMVKVHECVPNDPDPALADGCDTTGQVYWEATEVDINGAITRAQLGNGLVTEREVNKVTGAIRSIRTSGFDANNRHVEIQDQEFRWDLAGNLEMRHDRRIHDQGGIKQEFDYDALDRLTGTTTHYNIAGVDAQSRYNVYADNGNLRCKEHTSSTCATEYRYHPGTHAVASATGASTDDYGYDANGSMTHGPNDRHITWTAFNKPLRIDGADGAYARFAYDHNRARYRMESSDGSATTVTTYIGSLYERVQTGDTTTHRFHIFAGGEAVAVYSCTMDCGEDPNGNTADGTKAETRYLHKDHLGSIVAITDGFGEEKERFHYTAWGEQKRWKSTEQAFVPASSAEQDRGFTGHVMLEALGLIHMNGRIYDQNLGRFISADPFVQFPEAGQSYNRYSYVNNNPLSYTDPSGYFSLKKELGRALGHVAGYLSFIPGCQLWCSALAGAVSGYLLTGELKGAVLGGLSGLASGAMAQWADQKAFGSGFSGWLKGAATAGAMSGALSAAGGGRFGDGFLSGFAGSTAGFLSGGNPVAAAILGGTVSKIGGGKFASGAKSAFFHTLFGGQVKAMFSGDAGGSNAQKQQANNEARQKAVSVDATNPAGQRTGFWAGVASVVGKIWALPATVVGLVYGGIGHVAGLIMGTDPSISFGNNAIQFHNNPLMPTAMALGNVILYGTGADYQHDSLREYSTLGYEEMQHTRQAEILGPLYLLTHGVFGSTAFFTNGYWHGSNNLLERGPHANPPSPWGY